MAPANFLKDLCGLMGIAMASANLGHYFKGEPKRNPRLLNTKDQVQSMLNTA
jgi:hypothetical protein